MKYWLIGCIGLGIAAVLLVRYWYAPSVIFHPWKEIETTPASLGLVYEEVALRADDGETIMGWFVPARGGGEEDGERTLLFFHGNAGNISHRLETISYFHSLGLSVFIIDYRGFGKSTGKPSVAGTMRDARAAWQWLTVEKKIPASQIIVFGRSLGGGVAANLGTEVNPRALILESTFTSLHDVGKKMFPGLPKWLLGNDYDTLTRIVGQAVPLLVVHSPDDEVIDFAMGRKLYESYEGPKAFVEISGSHGRGWFESLAVYDKGVKAFLETL